MTHKKINWAGRLSAAATLSAITIAPLTSASAVAEAAPAGKLGSRQSNTRNRDALVTLRGTVTRDLAGDQFEMRLSNGRVTRVVLQRNVEQPRGLSMNDVVEVRGYQEGKTVVARSVRIVEQNRPGRTNSNRSQLRGVVTSNFNGRSFGLRANDGRAYTVRLRNDAPLRLTVGDRVEAVGSFENNVFVADDVNILRNDDGNHVNFVATVVSDDAADRITVRGDDGRTYEVQSRDRFSARVTKGDRVRILGVLRNNVVTVDRVVMLQDRTRNGNTNANRSQLRGVVTRNYNGRDFQMRADNGRTYTVRPRNAAPPRLTSGDRVEAFGSFANGVLIADDVNILRNDDANRVNFAGTVVSVRSDERITVRGDNGRTYEVQSRDRFSSRVTKGDRVRIVGVMRNNVVMVDRVELLRDDTRNGNNTRDGQSVNFTGVVTEVNANFNFLHVRGDNGRQYVVRFPNVRRFSVRDRVRVVGTTSGKVIAATSVTRI